MERFTVHTGTVAPLRRSGVDTDQIIPSEFLKRVSRRGFADGLFASWRSVPGFVLDRPEHAAATILVAGPDFGVGSSREHAVWALQDRGFRVIVSPRFGDIFASNAAGCGLLTLTVDQAVVEALWQLAEGDPAAEVTVDLVAGRLVAPAAGLDHGLDVDPYLRWRLLEGLDDIALTLRHLDLISSYEQSRPSHLPRTISL
jgi:3-isopropylmalate/(R)-2-methylmalate dehydratase small subunit